MATYSTYLNFKRETEEAFNFYKSVFGGEFMGGIMRYGEMPADENTPPVPDDVKNLVLHMSLTLPGGHILMGSDAPDGMGFELNPGNSVYTVISPDSREEAERLFKGLSEGGKIEMDLQDTFWGAYYGSFLDKFGIGWMINYQHSDPQQQN